MIPRICFSLLALIIIVQTPQRVSSAEPTTAAVDRTRLLGSWMLVKHGHFDPSGQYHSTGDHVTGELIYAADGSMSVLIAKIPEPAQLNDIIAYSGTFSIDANVVSHHVKVAADSKRANTTEPRVASFRGEDLVLTTKPNADGYWEIVWRRRPSP
jgi:hypothetical protein